MIPVCERKKETKNCFKNLKKCFFVFFYSGIKLNNKMSNSY